MAKTSGGIRRSRSIARGLANDLNDDDIDIKNRYPLSDIKNPDVFRQTKQAISKFHGRLGLKTREVALADIRSKVSGRIVPGVSFENDNGQIVVYLDRKFFQNSERSIVSTIRQNYKGGYLTRTNKPIQHITTHELAHTVWTNDMGGRKYRDAGVEIRRLYSKWRQDNKSGLSSKLYGDYAGYNINEFVAETLTKGTIGNSDKYTRRLISIIKKHNL